MGRMRIALLLVFAVLTFSSAAVGQVLTGNIIGTVKDESSAVLPGATITLTSATALPGGPLTGVTNERGEYRFTQLKPGTYALTAQLSGFNTYQEDGLQITVGGTVERAIVVKLGSLAETITVSGETPMVDPRKIGAVTDLGQESVERLPTNRHAAWEFVKWVPGVASSNPTGEGGSVGVMGAAVNENSYLLDGIMLNHPGTGNSWDQGDEDSVVDLQATTLGASAEYQVAQGGVFNLVTKSGSNAFRFDAIGYWRPDRFVTKPIKRDCNCSLGQTGFTSIDYISYAGHGGGPIKKDRLWFFTGGNLYMKQVTNPGVDPRFNPPLRLRYVNNYMGKVNWQIKDTVKLNVVSHTEWWIAFSPGFPTIQNPLETSIWNGGPSPQYSGELLWTISSKTLLTVRSTGWEQWQPSGPLRGDPTTPRHVDQVTGIACCGVAQLTNVRLSRHGQMVKVNHFVQGNRVAHDWRSGLQFEEARDTTAGTYPSGAQYSDLDGRPDQATFRAPFVSAASYRSIGLWGEDQLTVGRLTVNLGARFDRMHAFSPDQPVVNTLLSQTGATSKGLGDMFSWNAWAPRVGFNLRLTENGQTIVRGYYGRAFRTVFLNDFENVHPGLSPITLARWNPATGSYSTIISVTDPRSNIAVDSSLEAPFTDSFSIGLDRQLMPNVGVGVTYAHKRGKNQVGWTDVGGLYGTQTAVLPDGRTVTVHPLLNATSARLFQTTNAPGLFNRYDGLILSLDKRMSRRWQANLSYTYSRAEGLVTTGSAGQDPNDLVNATGRLSTDLPHAFVARAAVQVPWAEVEVSPNFMALSGAPFAPQALIQLPQGRRSVNIEPPDGSYRLPTQYLLAIRFSKALRRGDRSLELIADLRNTLQNKGFLTLLTQNFFSATFAQPSNWIEPRQLYLGIKARF